MTQEDRSAIAVLAARFCEKTPDIMSLADRLEQVISDKTDWIKMRDAKKCDYPACGNKREAGELYCIHHNRKYAQR